jgi:hypothetical protein
MFIGTFLSGQNEAVSRAVRDHGVYMLRQGAVLAAIGAEPEAAKERRSRLGVLAAMETPR